MNSPATDSRSQPHGEDYWRRLDQLDSLLRSSDFSTSPDRWQNVHDLLLKLLEGGRLPEDPEHLRPLLAPLFCRTAREQEQFTKLFGQWLRLIQPQARQTQLHESAQSKKQITARPPPKKPLLPILLGLLLALIMTLLGGYYISFERDTTVAPPPPKTETRPDEITQTDIADLKLEAIPPRRPLETPSLDVYHRAYVGAGQWLLRLLPGLIGLAWLALLWRGWQTVLERRRRSERQQDDPLHTITLAAEVDELLDSAPLRSALRRLHTPVAYPTRRMHIDATVQATAHHAGLLQPVFADRMSVPECVVLVEYRHGADQMAALAQLACHRLEVAGLTIHRYYYQQDPRQVREAAGSGPGRWLAINEVAGRYPDARLLLIGEPAALINPWSLVLRPWAEVLAWWPQRGLLATRLQPHSWLRTFQAEGLAVADLSSAGLASMAEHLAGLPPQDQVTSPRVLLPRELQNSEAWLSPLTPPESEKQVLLQQLQLFLGGNGLLLLSAMAAYPELHWGLTRALDLNLALDSDPDNRELRLLRIARLPWCREGWLPDWLRETLLEQCSKDQRQTIARLYQQLMGLADIDGQGEISLPFDISGPETRRGLRSWLKRLTQLAPDGSSLRDRIFTNALLGNRLRKIDFLLPRNLTSRLPAGGVQLLFPRLLLVLLLGGLAGWGLDRAWQHWLQEPVRELAQAAQLAEHGRFRVQILHTAETLQLAQALSETLSRFGFQPPEMRELKVGELSGEDGVKARNNTVQWALAEDVATTADFVAKRLAYLNWGLEPVVANQLSEQVTNDEALQQLPELGELRVWLLTSGRTSSPFSVTKEVLEAYQNGELRKLTLKAPDIAENGAVVPISADSDRTDISAVWLMTPEGCLYTEMRNLSRSMLGYYSTRLKMSHTGTVIALAQTGSGEFIGAEKKIKVTIGSSAAEPDTWCSRDVTTNFNASVDVVLSRLDQAVGSGKTIKLRAKLKDDVVTLKALLTHPMETGTRNDRSTGERIPAHYIETVAVYLEGRQPMTYLHLGPHISRNPYFSVKWRGIGKKGDKVRIAWVDNKGQSDVIEGEIK